MAKVKEVVVEAGESKEKRMSKLMDKMEKDFGKGSVIGANAKADYHDFISTGSIGLDKALGIGGLPKGRIIEIFGPESSGKTTIAMHVIAQAQKANPQGYCAMVDAEQAFSPAYADGLGIDRNRLSISQPDYGEQGLEITKQLIESGEYDVVVVDSVAALVPKAELEGQVGDAKMALQARMMSQALRMLVGSVNKTNTVLIFINQLREKIGSYGNPEVTTGGNALKFYASVRLDVRRNYAKDKGGMIEDGQIYGNLTKVKVIKNKVAPPFRQCEFNIIYGEGIDNFGEMIDAAIEAGVIKQAGSWFSYGENKIGQGKESVRELLKDNDELYLEIKAKVEQTFVPKEFVPNLEDQKQNDGY